MPVSWIFAIVAGGIIMVLFFKAAMTQKQLSADKSAIRLMTDYDAITQSLLQTAGVSKPLPLPSGGLKFSCTESCQCQMEFGKFSTPLGEAPLFAPNNMQADSATVYVLDWRVPYRAANLMYMTTPDIAYFWLDKDLDTGAQAIKSTLNEKLKRVISIKDISSTNALTTYAGAAYSRIVIITSMTTATFNSISNFGTDNIKTLGSTLTRPDNIHIVNIRHDGTLNFIDIVPNPTKSKVRYAKTNTGYFGTELIIGAIMANDANTYICSMRNAFGRMAGVAGVLKKRALGLKDKVSASTAISDSDKNSCIIAYQDIAEKNDCGLCILQQTALSISSESNYLEKNAAAAYTRMNEAVGLLRNKNALLLYYGKACPVVY